MVDPAHALELPKGMRTKRRRAALREEKRRARKEATRPLQPEEVTAAGTILTTAHFAHLPMVKAVDEEGEDLNTIDVLQRTADGLYQASWSLIFSNHQTLETLDELRLQGLVACNEKRSYWKITQAGRQLLSRTP